MSESEDEEVMIRENERIPLLSDIQQDEDQEQQLTYWQRLRQRSKRYQKEYYMSVYQTCYLRKQVSRDAVSDD